MHYIYLNYYNNGTLYVGSHVWSGEGLDPNYFGSSGVADHYGWKPIKIRILEITTSERRLKAEGEWIERYCKRFGIANCALALAYNHKDGWEKRFRPGGRMLNLHSNNAEAARAANILRIKEYGFTEAQKKSSSRSIRVAQKIAVQKLKETGPTPKQLDALKIAKEKQLENLKVNGASEKLKSHCRKVIRKAQAASVEKVKMYGISEHQKEACRENIKVAIKAAAKKVKAEGLSEKQLKCKLINQPKLTELAHTEEAMERMVNKRKQNNSYLSGAIKGAKTQIAKNSIPGYKSVRIVKCTVDGVDYIGAIKTVCQEIGNPNWSCTITKKFRDTGAYIVIHHGVEFKLISVRDRKV